tara:strand:- start:115 stop:453 length:339 start_codon:yes stop_codon:yes gene_type:complete
MKNRSLDIDGLASFYNDYEVIKFDDPNELKSKATILKDQMEELVNFVLPCLVKLAENNETMPVGMLLASLVSENRVSEEKFIEVQMNLKAMKELDALLGFDKKISGILNALV